MFDYLNYIYIIAKKNILVLMDQAFPIAYLLVLLEVYLWDEQRHFELVCCPKEKNTLKYIFFWKLNNKIKKLAQTIIRKGKNDITSQILKWNLRTFV